MHNDDFAVQALLSGEKEWLDPYKYKVAVDRDTKSEASMVQFDFEVKVEIWVKVNNGMIHDVKIRPFSKEIKHTIDWECIFFSLNKPAKLSFEVNGDCLRNLHIFANPLESDITDPNNPDVIYFGPGLHGPHDKPGNSFNISCGQSTELKINNLKSFSTKGWSNGIDLMSCSDVTINDIFMRNSDDCITIYAHRWNFCGDVENITVQNAILWANIAHPINIYEGTETIIRLRVIHSGILLSET